MRRALAHSAFIALEADDDFLENAAGGAPNVPDVLDGARVRFATDAAELAAMAAITPHDVSGPATSSRSGPDR